MHAKVGLTGLVLLTMLLFGCADPPLSHIRETVPPVTTAAYEESAAAEISMTDALGQRVLLSDYIGRPVLLKFWASWSAPSMDELSALQRAYDAYGEDVAFLAVNMTDGTRETQQTAQDFIDEQGFTFPVLYDLDGSAAAVYDAGPAPVTVFIDADGFIVTRSQGEINEDALLFGLKLL